MYRSRMSLRREIEVALAVEEVEEVDDVEALEEVRERGAQVSLAVLVSIARLRSMLIIR